MPGKTSKYKIPYPTANDPVQNLPTLLQDLALGLEDTVSTIQTTPGPQGEPGPRGPAGTVEPGDPVPLPKSTIDLTPKLTNPGVGTATLFVNGPVAMLSLENVAPDEIISPPSTIPTEFCPANTTHDPAYISSSRSHRITVGSDGSIRADSSPEDDPISATICWAIQSDVSAMSGPAGPVGPPGPQGDPGPQGPAGQDAQSSVERWDIGQTGAVALRCGKVVEIRLNNSALINAPKLPSGWRPADPINLPGVTYANFAWTWTMVRIDRDGTITIDKSGEISVSFIADGN